MKRLLIIVLAGIFSAATISAQDMALATETFNNGAMAIEMGEYSSAITSFQNAMELARGDESDEAQELIAKCRDRIPKLYLQLVKEYAKVKEYDLALMNIVPAMDAAEEYGDATVAEEAKALRSQIMMQKANGLLREKKFAEAAEIYGDIVSAEPENGRAYFSLGQAQAASGNIAGAEEAYLKAAELGQQKDAYKQLSNIYVKAAAAELKAKKYAEAITAALKSNEYLENATAYKVAGTAASQSGKNADAIKYLEKYLQMSPNAKDAPQMNYTIAALSQKAGDKAKAKEYYQKLVADPTYGETAKQQLQAL